MKITPDQSMQILMMVIDRTNSKTMLKLLEEKDVLLFYLINGRGTAKSETLKAFGLSDTEKSVFVCILEKAEIKPVMTAIVERLELHHPGNGIAFTFPITAISGGLARLLESVGEDKLEQDPITDLERQSKVPQKSEHEPKAKHELVIAIVRSGYSEEIMKAAKLAGARGGTVIHARQAAVDKTTKFFGIALQPEREFVLIATETPNVPNLLQQMTKVCGIKTPAKGIMMSIPLTQCVGIMPSKPV
ncbi:MAG: hypothetical protein FWG68_02905 [Defluviitaleaceae bacterium]|nr:hypothetical protein [Defluviitaleaceae bacterium]